MKVYPIKSADNHMTLVSTYVAKLVRATIGLCLLLVRPKLGLANLTLYFKIGIDLTLLCKPIFCNNLSVTLKKGM